MNEQGDRFAAEPGSGPEGLPVLNGPEGGSRLVTARYREFSRRMAGVGKTLNRLELDQRNAWRIHLADGPVIDLGREDLSRRLERFARLYQRIVAKDSRRPVRVDLRYANGFAVQFADSEQEAPAAERQGALQMGELANAKKA